MDRLSFTLIIDIARGYTEKFWVGSLLAAPSRSLSSFEVRAWFSAFTEDHSLRTKWQLTFPCVPVKQNFTWPRHKPPVSPEFFDGRELTNVSHWISPLLRFVGNAFVLPQYPHILKWMSHSLGYQVSCSRRIFMNWAPRFQSWWSNPYQLSSWIFLRVTVAADHLGPYDVKLWGVKCDEVCTSRDDHRNRKIVSDVRTPYVHLLFLDLLISVVLT